MHNITEFILYYRKIYVGINIRYNKDSLYISLLKWHMYVVVMTEIISMGNIISMIDDLSGFLLDTLLTYINISLPVNILTY